MELGRLNRRCVVGRHLPSYKLHCVRLYEVKFSFFFFFLERKKLVVRYIELAKARSYTLLRLENPLRVFSCVLGDFKYLGDVL